MNKYILLLILSFGSGHVQAQEQFVKTLHFNELEEFLPFDSEETKDGGQVFVYPFRLPNSVDGSAISKTDAQGELEWNYSFISESQQESRIYQILEREEGGYMAFGYEYFPSKIFVILLDQNGILQWRKDFVAGYNLGSFGAIKTKDSGYMIVGEITANANSQPNCCFIKLDANANAEWAQYFKATAPFSNSGLLQLDDGGYLLASSTYFDAVNTNVSYVIRTNANGNRIWAKTFGPGFSWNIDQIGNDSFLLSSVEVSPANYYITKFICINGKGDKIWAKQVNSDTKIQIIDSKLSKDGNSVLYTGQIQKKDSRFYGLLLSMSKKAEIEWAKSYRVTSSDGYLISLAQDGGYLLTGFDIDVLDDRNIVMIKTDALGNVGCLEKDETIILDDYDFVSDTVGYSVPFTVQVKDIINMPITLNPIEYTVCTTVSSNEAQNIWDIKLSPNPVSEELTIQLSEGMSNGNIKIAITDLTGKTLFKEKYMSYDSTYRVNTSNLVNGLYLLTVMSDNSSQTIKFVVNH